MRAANEAVPVLDKEHKKQGQNCFKNFFLSVKEYRTFQNG
jgi:hypothetical protein